MKSRVLRAFRVTLKLKDVFGIFFIFDSFFYFNGGFNKLIKTIGQRAIFFET